VIWNDGLRQWIPRPIAIGSDAVYMVLYTTGIRNRSQSVQIGYFGKNGIQYQPVVFAGAQGQYPGLDQVNVQLPSSLNGLGQTVLWLAVDGANPSNVVTVNFQ